MKIVLKFCYDFVLLFLIFIIVYRVFINKKKKTYSKLKENDEVKLFVKRFNLDIKKQDYKKLLNAISLVNSLILSFTSTLVLYIDSMIWSIIVGFAVLFVLIYSLYEIVGRYFKKLEGEKNV